MGGRGGRKGDHLMKTFLLLFVSSSLIKALPQIPKPLTPTIPSGGSVKPAVPAIVDLKHSTKAAGKTTSNPIDKSTTTTVHHVTTGPTVVLNATVNFTDSSAIDNGDSSTTYLTDSATTDLADRATTDLTDSATIDLADRATTDLTDRATTDLTDSATTDLTDRATTDLTDSSTADLTDSATTDLTDSSTADLTDSATTDLTDSSTANLTDSATTDVTERSTIDLTERSTTDLIDSSITESTNVSTIFTSNAPTDSFVTSTTDVTTVDSTWEPEETTLPPKLRRSVSDIKVTNQTFNSLTVSWEAPNTTVRLSWELDGKEDFEELNETSYTINELRSDRNYNICVGVGDDNKCIEGHTLQLAAPWNVTWNEQSSTSIDIHWEVPETYKDSVNYTVSLSCEEEQEEKLCGCSCQNQEVNTTEDSVTLNVTPSTNYTVTVTAFTHSDKNTSDPVSLRTCAEAPSVPDVLTTVGKRDVSFFWNASCPFAKHVIYSIHLENGTETLNRTGCSFEYSTAGLEPFRNYSYVVNADGCGVQDSCTSNKQCSVNETRTFRTKPDVPSPPGTIEVTGPKFDTQGSDSKIATIDWTKPKNQNGKFRSYSISISKVEKEEFLVSTGVVFENKFKVELLPDTLYRIRVSASNIDPPGYGEESSLEVETESGVPFFTGPAWRNKTIKDLDETKFFPIDIVRTSFNESNGKIIEVSIKLHKIPEESYKLKAHETEHIFGKKCKCLEPKKSYKFEIKICTKKRCNSTMGSFETKDVPGNALLAVCLTLVFLSLLLVALYVAYTRFRSPMYVRLWTYLSVIHNPTPELPLLPMVPPDECTERRILVSNLADAVSLLHAEGRRLLTLEYNELKRLSPSKSTNHALLSSNEGKNRYINILPFDETRVVLNEYRSIPCSDYINASYLHGYQKPLEFIASQGPKQDLKDDFWRMIWEKNIHVVVMVTQCIEGNKAKCSLYWPSPSDVKGWTFPISRLTVQTVLEVKHQPGGYITRKFQLSKGTKTRMVQQFHYVSWPDMGCPQTPDQLIQFVRAVRAATPKESSHTLVHCSAGVGRTGTFIALNNLMDELDTEASVDVFNCVYRMRHHRVNMVQTLDQYSFVYKCILKYYLDSIGKGNEFSVEDIEPILQVTTANTPQLEAFFGVQEEYTEDEGLIPISDSDESADEKDEKEKQAEETENLIDIKDIKANGNI